MRIFVPKLILAACIWLFYSTAFAQPSTEAQAWAALRNNGILLLRHATAPGGGDPPGFKLGDCATQRNLDEVGRAQARDIGVQFQAQKITALSVITSQWCRCQETADLAFPGKRKDAPAFNSFFQDPALENAQTKAARALLLGWDKTEPLAVVTHQVNITALTGVVPAPGEGVVLRRKGKVLKVIGQIKF